MAGRIRLHTLLRDIHLYCAFITVVFLLMYFVTGFLMVRQDWFESEPEVIRETIDITIPAGVDQKKISGYLRKTLDLRGRSKYWKNKDGIQFFEYNTLSHRTQIRIKQNLEEISLEKRILTPYQTITAFHRLHNYGGGVLYNLYILMMDLTSISLIIFAVTGVYLWLKALPSWKWGLVMLSLGMGYTLWVALTFIW